jgi:hypothetical protein
VAKPKQGSPRNDARREYDVEHRPADRPERARPDEGDLVGESEYTTREAGERSTVRRSRVPGGPALEEPLVASHDMLGRRYLEEATEAPGRDEVDPALEPLEDLQEDTEESAAAVEATRDPASDPISTEAEDERERG